MQFKPQKIIGAWYPWLLFLKKFPHNSFIFFNSTPSLGLKFKIWTDFTFFLNEFWHERSNLSWVKAILSLDTWSGAI